MSRTGGPDGLLWLILAVLFCAFTPTVTPNPTGSPLCHASSSIIAAGMGANVWTSRFDGPGGGIVLSWSYAGPRQWDVVVASNDTSSQQYRGLLLYSEFEDSSKRFGRFVFNASQQLVWQHLTSCAPSEPYTLPVGHGNESTITHRARTWKHTPTKIRWEAPERVSWADIDTWYPAGAGVGYATNTSTEGLVNVPVRFYAFTVYEQFKYWDALPFVRNVTITAVPSSSNSSNSTGGSGGGGEEAVCETRLISPFAVAHEHFYWRCACTYEKSAYYGNETAAPNDTSLWRGSGLNLTGLAAVNSTRSWLVHNVSGYLQNGGCSSCPTSSNDASESTDPQVVLASDALWNDDLFQLTVLGDYTIQWFIRGDSIYFELSAPELNNIDGWVGLGFNSQTMDGGDIVYCKHITAGDIHCEDRYGVGHITFLDEPIPHDIKLPTAEADVLGEKTPAWSVNGDSDGSEGHYLTDSGSDSDGSEGHYLTDSSSDSDSTSHVVMGWGGAVPASLPRQLQQQQPSQPSQPQPPRGIIIGSGKESDPSSMAFTPAAGHVAPPSPGDHVSNQSVEIGGGPNGNNAVRFHRRLDTGDRHNGDAIITASPMNIIFAKGFIASSHSLEDRGTASVNFFSGSAVVSDESGLVLIRRGHGLTMVVTWMLMYPMGGFVARHLKHKAYWLERHVLYQRFGAIGTISFAVVALMTSSSHFQHNHSIVGFLLTIALFIQLFLGCAARSRLESHDAPTRCKWFSSKIHVFLGIGMVLVAPFQCVSGMDLLYPAEKFWNMSLTEWIYVVFSLQGIVYLLAEIARVKTRHFTGISSHSIRKDGRDVPQGASIWAPKVFAELEEISWQQIAERVRTGSQWLVIDELVVDIGDWVGSHPGGRNVLLSRVGTDSTMNFHGLEEGSGGSRLFHAHSGAAIQTLLQLAIGKVRAGASSAGGRGLTGREDSSLTSRNLRALARNLVLMGRVPGKLVEAFQYRPYALLHRRDIITRTRLKLLKKRKSGLIRVQVSKSTADVNDDRSALHGLCRQVPSAKVAHFSFDLLKAREMVSWPSPPQPDFFAKNYKVFAGFESAVSSKTHVRVSDALSQRDMWHDSPDLASLYLLPGQHVYVQAIVGGVLIERAYTPVPSPQYLCADIHHVFQCVSTHLHRQFHANNPNNPPEGDRKKLSQSTDKPCDMQLRMLARFKELCLVIKHYEVGKMSRHLDTIRAGSLVKVRGPEGDSLLNPDRVDASWPFSVMVAGGSGITPMLQYMYYATQAYLQQIRRRLLLTSQRMPCAAENSPHNTNISSHNTALLPVTAMDTVACPFGTSRVVLVYGVRRLGDAIVVGWLLEYVRLWAGRLSVVIAVSSYKGDALATRTTTHSSAQNVHSDEKKPPADAKRAVGDVKELDEHELRQFIRQWWCPLWWEGQGGCTTQHADRAWNPDLIEDANPVGAGALDVCGFAKMVESVYKPVPSGGDAPSQTNSRARPYTGDRRFLTMGEINQIAASVRVVAGRPDAWVLRSAINQQMKRERAVWEAYVDNVKNNNNNNNNNHNNNNNNNNNMQTPPESSSRSSNASLDPSRVVLHMNAQPYSPSGQISPTNIDSVETETDPSVSIIPPPPPSPPQHLPDPDQQRTTINSPFSLSAQRTATPSAKNRSRRSPFASVGSPVLPTQLASRTHIVGPQMVGGGGPFSGGTVVGTTPVNNVNSKRSIGLARAGAGAGSRAFSGQNVSGRPSSITYMRLSPPPLPQLQARVPFEQSNVGGGSGSGSGSGSGGSGINATHHSSPSPHSHALHITPSNPQQTPPDNSQQTPPENSQQTPPENSPSGTGSHSQTPTSADTTHQRHGSTFTTELPARESLISVSNSGSSGGGVGGSGSDDIVEIVESTTHTDDVNQATIDQTQEPTDNSGSISSGEGMGFSHATIEPAAPSGGTSKPGSTIRMPALDTSAPQTKSPNTSVSAPEEQDNPDSDGDTAQFSPRSDFKHAVSHANAGSRDAARNPQHAGDSDNNSRNGPLSAKAKRLWGDVRSIMLKKQPDQSVTSPRRRPRAPMFAELAGRKKAREVEKKEDAMQDTSLVEAGHPLLDGKFRSNKQDVLCALCGPIPFMDGIKDILEEQIGFEDGLVRMLY